MSYNISSWRTKVLDGLSLSVADLCFEGSYFEAPELDVETGKHTIYGMDGTEITGAIAGDVLMVETIHVSGEGSGTTFHDYLLPALEESTGVLVAALVWEGGDSITLLEVLNGTVTHKDLEI